MIKDQIAEIQLAQRVQRIKPSPTMAVAARAEELQAQGKNIISLSIGEPDFDTPEHIKAAAIQSLQEGHTKYTAVDGLKKLKQAIIEKLARENQLSYGENQILVSCGAKHSIYNLLEAVIELGDEVIIPAPYWVSYPDMVKLADGNPVIVTTDFANQFKMTPTQLRAAITAKTRMLILNSPSNPTGIAYNKHELAALAQVLLEYPQILLVSDDIYERNLWNHLPFCNIVNACPELYDRTFVINGVSKTYAMTGWRLGYTAGPAKVIAAMKKIQSQSTSNVTTMTQYAAIAALTGEQTCVNKMSRAYKERHDYLLNELRKIPEIECLPSDGTFYTFPRISGLYNKQLGVTNDMEFAEFLLNEAEIAVIPGSAFGAPDHVRICYTTSMENIIEAAKRLQLATQKLRGA